MPSTMPREKCHLAAFERAEDVSIRRLAEGRILFHFLHISEPGHGIKPAAADDSNLRLRQTTSR